MSTYIPVGRVTSPHGIKGEVKFHYYNEVHEDFFKYTSLYYDDQGEKKGLKLKNVRLAKKGFILSFEEIKDRSFAEKLKGMILYVREEDLPPLKDGEYYFFHLIGLNVFDEKGKNLGRIKEIMKTGANEVLVIEGKEEILIPMVDTFVLSIDLKRKSVLVRKPEYI